MKSSPRSPQLEKAHAQQRRPNTAKNKKNKELSPLKNKKDTDYNPNNIQFPTKKYF